jgi:hypothetical protein
MTAAPIAMTAAATHERRNVRKSVNPFIAWADESWPTNFQTASARSSGKSLISIGEFDHTSLLRARNKPPRAAGADSIASIEPGFLVLERAVPRPGVAAAIRGAQ